MDTEVAAARERHNIAFERDASEQIWVTIMIFNTVQQDKSLQEGPFVPSAGDVRRCIEEGKAIYGMCEKTTKLSCVREAPHALTEKHVDVIKKKLAADAASSLCKRRVIVPDENALTAFA